MQFEGAALRNVLRGQDPRREVEVYDGAGYPRGTVAPAKALEMVSGAFQWYGVGNPARVRYLRPAWASSPKSQANVTVVRSADTIPAYVKAHHRRCKTWNGLFGPKLLTEAQLAERGYTLAAEPGSFEEHPELLTPAERLNLGD